MLTLKQAFHSAFQQTSKHHVVCELCPMHQLHKLCQQVEGKYRGHVYKMYAFLYDFNKKKTTPKNNKNSQSSSHICHQLRRNGKCFHIADP